MVSRFAPVAPVNILRGLDSKKELGNYHLVLAHNVVDNSAAFCDLFKNKRFANPYTIIVDNSVIELGKPVEAEVIRWACQAFYKAGMSPSEVVAVLPDELLDAKGTTMVAAKALVDFRRQGLKNLMFVPQGKTFEEIVESAEAFQHVDEIRWIGVARNLARVLGSRERITKVLQSIFPSAKFHMLGFSDDLVDDMLSARLPGVEGIDSAVPLRLLTPMSMTMKYPRRGDWWNEDLQLSNQMLENVRQVRKWLSSQA